MMLFRDNGKFCEKVFQMPVTIRGCDIVKFDKYFFHNCHWLSGLVGEIVLDTHLTDLVNLCFKPIKVPLFIFEN